jgi:hypothetical protein
LSPISPTGHYATSKIDEQHSLPDRHAACLWDLPRHVRLGILSQKLPAPNRRRTERYFVEPGRIRFAVDYVHLVVTLVCAVFASRERKAKVLMARDSVLAQEQVRA